MDKETIPYWRNIYRAVRGDPKTISVKYANETLIAAEPSLMLGLSLYKPYSDTSFSEWKTKMKCDNKGLEVLVGKIAVRLNLNGDLAYDIFCNYLIFEYYGKADEIVEVSNLPIYTNLLIERIWQFYTADRMFYLNTIRHILEYYKDTSHYLHKVYSDFIKRHTMTKIKDVLLMQFKLIANEIDIYNCKRCTNLKDWVARNYIEQGVILINLILAIENLYCPSDCLELLGLFSRYSYGSKPDYYESIKVTNQNDIKVVKLLEHALLIVTVKSFWSNSGWSKDFLKFKEVIEATPFITEEHTIVLLTWCTMLTTLKLSDIGNEFARYVPHCLERCFKEDVFVKLLDVLRLPFLKNNQLAVVVKTATASLLEVLCQKSCDLYLIYKKKSAMEVLANLMEIPVVCGLVMNHTTPFYSLFSTGLNMFPHDFFTFTNICNVLLKYDTFKEQVQNLLKGIEVLTIENSKPLAMSTVTLETDQQPMPNIFIPAGTVARVLDNSPTCLIQYKGGFVYSYYQYFEYLFRTAVESCDANVQFPDDSEIIDHTCHGMKLVSRVLVLDHNLRIDPWVSKILNLAKYMVARAAVLKEPNLTLITSCFSLCVALLDIPSECDHVTNILTSLHCLRPVPKELYTLDALNRFNVLDDSIIFKLIAEERRKSEYNLFFAYTKLLDKTLLHDTLHEKFQIRGAMYLIYNVFPHHLNWHYADIFARNKVSQALLKYLLSILLKADPKSPSIEIQLVRQIVDDALLNYDPFIRSFLAILRISNPVLERLNCREYDWTSGRYNEVVTTIRLCLSVVMQLFNLFEEDGSFKKTKFWRLLFHTGSNHPSIIKVIVDYINNKFNTGLPKLACRLLKIIAQDTTVPILASLEVDNYQVQCMFLERLRNPLDDDELKVVLLELVTTCIKTQNGMTAAFFNLTLTRREADAPAETIKSYMSDYIRNIENSHEYLKSPLQGAILHLFHTLWLENKTILVEDLVGINFWKCMVNPLLEEFSLDCSVYMKILDILAFEVAKTNIDESLHDILKRLFDSEFPRLFTEHIEHLLDTEENHKPITRLLVSWKKFIVFSVKGEVICPRSKQILTRSTLIGFTSYVRKAVDIALVKEWGGLYLYLITRCKEDAYESEFMVQRMADCLKHLENVYQYLPKKSKEIVIAIIIKTIEHFDEIFRGTTDKVDYILESIGKIYDKEYEAVLKSMKKPDMHHADYTAWSLLVIFANKMLKYERHHRWIFYVQIFTRIYKTIGYFLSYAETMPLATISFMFLIEYVETDMSKEFLSINYEEFYYSINIPTEFFNFSSCPTTGIYPSNMNEFWMAYTNLIHLNLILIRKFDSFMFGPVLEFMNLHRDSIVAVMQLPRFTVDEKALTLVSMCMKLCNHMFKWKDMWKQTEECLLRGYFKIVTECLNTCIHTIICPKVMKFYVVQENRSLTSVDRVPIEFIKILMDRIVEIVASCCMGLLELSPKLIEELENAPYDDYYDDIIDYEFLIPNPNYTQTDGTHLTFGGVLCLVHYLCKTISQILKGDKKSGYVSTVTFNSEPEPDEPKGDYIVLIHSDYLPSNGSYEKFSSVQRFANSEIHNLTVPWLSLMNKRTATYALEALNTLLASQVFKAISTGPADPMRLPLLRRDLCSELQFYHEFIRKKLINQQKYHIDGNTVLRNKHFPERTDDISESGEYLLMLSHWYLVICQLTP